MPRRSRRTPLVSMMLLAALSACKREPTFDERYAGAQKAIREKAGELDKDIGQRERESRELERAAPQPPPS
ncbi:hypothetical protein GGR39_002643 [Novosphingobium fluoreni]|uniref:Lipoprotein n=1 Tax=Novosphingobium fluoreni TaxID=1391222 RepID=A0A7W6FZC8_9SPHN|nr:hypothetical protein [Novosphingobium fluoreni]MBB3940980.1 hypothetical protein [Novosphingobium fluoreni]